MRHQDWAGRKVYRLFRFAADQPAPQPAFTVTSHDDEVSLHLVCEFNDPRNSVSLLHGADDIEVRYRVSQTGQVILKKDNVMIVLVIKELVVLLEEISVVVE